VHAPSPQTVTPYRATRPPRESHPHRSGCGAHPPLGMPMPRARHQRTAPCWVGADLPRPLVPPGPYDACRGCRPPFSGWRPHRPRHAALPPLPGSRFRRWTGAIPHAAFVVAHRSWHSPTNRARRPPGLATDDHPRRYPVACGGTDSMSVGCHPILVPDTIKPNMAGFSRFDAFYRYALLTRSTSTRVKTAPAR
jgi:hypothetical protein